MFATRLGRGLGRLQMGLLRVCAGQAAGRWACGACHARRYVSGGRERPPGPEPEASPPGPARRTLKEWALLVSPFGGLRARLPCHLTVKPLDPLTYPDADHVLVALSGVQGSAQDPAGLQVEYDEALGEVAIVSDSIGPQASVEVNVPLKFGK